MFGSVDKNGNANIEDMSSIRKTLTKDQVIAKDTNLFYEIRGEKHTIPTSATYYFADGTKTRVEASGTDSTTTVTAGSTNFDFVTFDVNIENASVIEISAETFPGTYYVTGDTYARSEKTGNDEFFQFIIQKAKVLSEVTLTMEAEGDPSTFSMNLKVLRPSDGKMMKLVKYNIQAEGAG